MNLKDLYAKARLLRLALASEYDLEKKEKISEQYRKVIKKIEIIIKSAPF